MQPILELRKTHGGVHVTVFEDGLLVPWKPLSLQDWIVYTRDYNRGVVPESHLEDEIFRKCVLDESIIRQMDFMRAGIITGVVSHIWQHSGPTDAAKLTTDLNTARDILHAPGAEVMHDMARLITTAFPYKPEEVYDMDYETFLMRVAQAEVKLISLGVIPEPIVIEAREQGGKPASKPRRKVDAKKLYDQQQAAAQTARNQAVQQQKKETAHIPREKWWKRSPVLEAKKEHHINLCSEANEIDAFSLDSHDLNEPPEMQKYLMEMKTKDSRAKMIEDAKVIYKDLLAELAKKKKKK